MVDKIILGYLKIKKLTSYDIKKAMDSSVNHFYSSSLGSINPALKKLEKQGCIICHEVVENSRVKKYYELTPKGLSVYTKWQKSPIDLGRLKEDSLVRLYFMGDNEKETRVSLINNYLQEIKQMHDQLTQIKMQANEKEVPEQFAEVAKFQKATVEYGIDYYDFAYNWFKKLIDKENS